MNNRFREILRWIANARLTTEPRYPDGHHIGYGGRTTSGVRVTHDTAFRQATVWAAHRYLTQTVAQLPGRVLREGPNGFPKRISNHPINTLLEWRVNPELSPFQFKETLMSWAVTHGNGVAEIARDNRGQVVALWPIHPDRIQFRRNVETDALEYHIDNGPDGLIVMGVMDVFHLRGFGHGPVGLSVIEYAAESIGWARATELFGASFFGEGMHFGGAIISKTKSTPDAIKRKRAELDALHRGPTRAGRWFIGDSDDKIEKMTATPEESQFVATMQHQVEEVCRWMGVPPQKVHHLLRMTFNNVEQLSIEVVVDAITPWAIRFEEEANFKLFGQNRQGFFVKLDLKGLLRGDFLSRQEGLQIMRRNGIVTANDWAALEDMDEIPSVEGGDKYIVEANMTSLAQVGEAPAPAPVAPAAANQAQPASQVMHAIADLRHRGRELLHAT